MDSKKFHILELVTQILVFAAAVCAFFVTNAYGLLALIIVGAILALLAIINNCVRVSNNILGYSKYIVISNFIGIVSMLAAFGFGCYLLTEAIYPYVVVAMAEAVIYVISALIVNVKMLKNNKNNVIPVAREVKAPVFGAVGLVLALFNMLVVLCYELLTQNVIADPNCVSLYIYTASAMIFFFWALAGIMKRNYKFSKTNLISCVIVMITTFYLIMVVATKGLVQETYPGYSDALMAVGATAGTITFFASAIFLVITLLKKGDELAEKENNK